jgi:hypothetical protein
MLRLSPTTETVLSESPKEKLLRATRAVTNISDLHYDEDEILSFPYRGLSIQLAAGGEPLRVNFYALLARNVSENARLFFWLRALNVKMVDMHCFIEKGEAMAVGSLQPVDLHCPEFPVFLQQFLAMANNVAIELQAIADGRMFVTEMNFSWSLH